MSFSHGSKAKLLLDGYDFSPYLKGVSMSTSLDTADVSVLGNTAKQYVTGLLDASLQLDGVFDGTADANLAGIFTSVIAGTPDQAIYTPQGYNAIGLPAHGLVGWITSQENSTPVGDAASFSAQFQSTNGRERGILLHPYQAEVAGGNTTGVDNAASSANGGAAYLQVSAGASLVAKVQDSADNSTWADVVGLTFTSASARSAQRLAIAGTIRRYTRVLWTGTGTFAVALARY